MKKGITMQPFIFIFAIIVAALVLVFGFKVVKEILSKADFAILADSMQDLEDLTKRYYNYEIGSEKEIKLRLPTKINCICIKDNLKSSTFKNVNCGDNKFKLQVKQDNTHSVFVFSNKLKLPINKFHKPPYLVPYKGNNIENPLCFKISKNKPFLEAKITSMGDHVKIEKL